MKKQRIVVTGAAGFIGSCMAAFLNQMGFENLILVDDFSHTNKNKNIEGIQFIELVNRQSFKIDIAKYKPDFIIHLGARTDTTEFNYSIFEELNISYSKILWNYSVDNNIPFIYASSAATYGDGTLGFDDDENKIKSLLPLNPYGESKQEFDLWVLEQKTKPPFFAGLKFFNVFGPNEFHKGRMASVVWHAFNQIRDTGSMNLFKSHNPDYKDGEQLRDFIYVKDVVKVIYYWMTQGEKSGIYNLGTGTTRSFLDLTKATFAALDKKPAIKFIDTPLDLRGKYQYYTKANMDKSRLNGYKDEFMSLEDSIKDYVQNYLVPSKFYGGS